MAGDAQRKEDTFDPIFIFCMPSRLAGRVALRLVISRHQHDRCPSRDHAANNMNGELMHAPGLRSADVDALRSSPTARCSSSTASLVIEEVITPLPIAIRTCAVVCPLRTSITLPGS